MGGDREKQEVFAILDRYNTMHLSILLRRRKFKLLYFRVKKSLKDLGKINDYNVIKKEEWKIKNKIKDATSERLNLYARIGKIRHKLHNHTRYKDYKDELNKRIEILKTGCEHLTQQTRNHF